MIGGTYTKKKVAELTGLTPRQVQFYTEEGVVEPDPGSGKGRGSVRTYSRENVIVFLIIKELADVKAGLGFLKKLAKEVKMQLGPMDIRPIGSQFIEKLTRTYLIIHPGRGREQPKVSRKVVSSLKGGEPILTVSDLEKHGMVLAVIPYRKLMEKAGIGNLISVLADSRKA